VDKNKFIYETLTRNLTVGAWLFGQFRKK